MKKILLLASFVAFLIAGTSAQEITSVEDSLSVDLATPGNVATPTNDLPGSPVSNESVEGYYRSHLQLPAEIRQLLDEQKAKEAVAEYDKFKKSTQADALDMLLLDAEVYGSASFIETNAGYGKMREEAVKKMVTEYPNNAEVILYELPDDGNEAKSLEVLSKAIKADPDYLPAYEMRCRIYLMQGKKDAACQDYAKLPEAVRGGLLGPGVDCSKELEAAESAKK